MLRKLLQVILLQFCLCCSAVLLLPEHVFADGTETLGPLPDGTLEKFPAGTTMIAAGTGMQMQPGIISLTLPDDAQVHQVLLYWEGQMKGHKRNPRDYPGDSTIRINGKINVTGMLISEPTFFFRETKDGQTYDVINSAFRADITPLGLIKAGENQLTLDELDFTRIVSGSIKANNGAGIIVIYSDPTNQQRRTTQIELRDGLDNAYCHFAGESKVTVAQDFVITPEVVERQGQLVLFISSVGTDRPNSIEITIDGGKPEKIVNELGDSNGHEWDTVNLPVTIPAQANRLTVQLFSRNDETTDETKSCPKYNPNRPQESPASLTWVAAGLVIAEPNPKLGIVKRINGEAVSDAKSGDVPRIAPGTLITWTYAVTNIGNVPFKREHIMVTDSDLGPVTAIIGQSDNTNSTLLAPGATWTYTISGPAVDLNIAPGITTVGGCADGGINALRNTYVNTGTVTASEIVTITATAADASYYCNPVIEEITLQKLVGNDDANTKPGLFIAVDEPITITYLVENVGEESLTAIKVTDADPVLNAKLNASCTIEKLMPKERRSCIVTSTAAVGQQGTMGHVCGTGSGESICDDDSAFYFGALVGLAFQKRTNGVYAATPPGPDIAVGRTVNWHYTITNTGNVTLTNVIVTDSDPTVIPNCPSTQLPIQLLPQATMICTATGVAQAGPYTNIGRVEASPPVRPRLIVTDINHYAGVVRIVDVDLELFVNGKNAGLPTGPLVNVGKAVTLTFRITNTGQVPLNSIVATATTIGGPGLTAVDCLPSTLAVGEAKECSVVRFATIDQQTIIGTVTARGDDGGASIPVQDGAIGHYFGVNAIVTITKLLNGQAVDRAPGPFINPDTEIIWTYRVDNPGNVTLNSVTVTDSDPVLNTPICVLSSLAVAVPTVCTVNSKAIAGAYAHTATVNAMTPTGDRISAVVQSYYSGTVSPAPQSLSLKPLTATLPLGAIHTITATVRDGQDAPIPNITVTFTVTGNQLVNGAGHAPAEQRVTDSRGQARFFYAGVIPGVDTIVATVQGTQGPIAETARVEWLAVSKPTITLEPLTATVRLGLTHTLTASVLNAQGVPLVNRPLSFTVTGANPQPVVAAITDGNGRVPFTYAGDIHGLDAITALMLDNGQPITATADVKWLDSWTITLTSAYTLIVGTPVTVDVVVTDHTDKVVPNARIFYEVKGFNKALALNRASCAESDETLCTDANGIARIRYPYAVDLNHFGADTITVETTATVGAGVTTTVNWIPVSMQLTVTLPSSISKEIAVILSPRMPTTLTAWLTTTVRQTNLVTHTVLTEQLPIFLVEEPIGQASSQFAAQIPYEPRPSPNLIYPGCDIQFPERARYSDLYPKAGEWILEVWLDLNQDGMASNEEPTCIFEEPTATTAPSLLGVAQDGVVHLTWQTGVEMNLVGFYLWRATGRAGPYTQLNQEIVLAEGNAIGASYGYVDRPTEPGVYYYQIETLFSSGGTQLSGPILILYPDESVLTHKMYIPYIAK